MFLASCTRRSVVWVTVIDYTDNSFPDRFNFSYNILNCKPTVIEQLIIRSGWRGHQYIQYTSTIIKGHVYMFITNTHNTIIHREKFRFK